MVVYYHEAMCHAEILVHYLQCQCHSKGLYDESMTSFIISSKLLVFATKRNLIVQNHKPE